VTEQLVERARRGDSDAFVALIEERESTMTRIATAILREPADVADALQEALVALWRELPRLRSADAWPAWSDRVLVNACRLVLRRRGRRRVREIALPGGRDPEGDALRLARESFDTEVVEREAFDRAFETLDADARAILVLHHLEERPLGEIAATLGIPVGTAKSRLFHARRRLAAAIALDEPVRSGASVVEEPR
jgi:RNA polymerase sigma-70 factor (ECF subfamily)